MDVDKEKMAQAKRKMLTSLRACDNSTRVQGAATDQNRGATKLDRAAPLNTHDALGRHRPENVQQEVKVEFTASQVNVEILPVRANSEGKRRLSEGPERYQGQINEQSRVHAPGEKQETSTGKSMIVNSLVQREGKGAAVRRSAKGDFNGVADRVSSERGGRGGRVGSSSIRRGGTRDGWTGRAIRPNGRGRGKPANDRFSWELEGSGSPAEEWGDIPKHQDPQPLEWRRRDVKEEEAKHFALDQLIALKKELGVAVERFQNGGAGARVGMRRLQGNEKNEWAFLDESDVSNFHEQIENPAMTFQFELDDFQKRAILQVEKGNSVFVAAHTSAGKTVIAEYAIALAAESERKVFYTSPIKTLSNQKLRDFREKFGDVGLVTGDVSIDDDAQCVIMTTEILRSMLYRGADVIRNVKYVIFDEVQFLNDEERGVVWEESIIMLPPHVVIIMLSATVPNALEFASWVGKTKNRKVAVVSTLKRPVPLKHSMLYHQRGSQEEVQETVLLEQGGSFLSENYSKALMARSGYKKAQGANEKPTNEKVSKQKLADQPRIDENISNEKTALKSSAMKPGKKGVNRNKGSSSKSDAAAATKGSSRGPNSMKSPWTPLVSFLNEKQCTPSVVFCFSKKKCEKAVQSLEQKDLLPDSGQKAYVHKFFDDAIVRLREEDRNLPQVCRVRNHLKRGFAAHHAGLLPLVKEITEILFSRGFVKVLFATETFAMGVNMPARTVVFAGLRKHDGRRFRNLEAGEYTQMSGRAGRRGHDKVGNVYIFFPPDERLPDAGCMCRIMTGKPISLRSAFRLTYNMILNVLRVDELRVEEVMKKSFSEAWGSTMAKGITAMLDKASKTLSQLNIAEVSSTPGPPSTSDQGFYRSESTTLESALPFYVAKFSELAQASSELTFRDINPIFRDAVRPGRAMIVELRPGFLSLCVVYSIVPPRRKSGVRQKEQTESQVVVRYESLLWVASISGVRPGAMRKHISSVLLLPDTQRKDKYMRDQVNPQVVSSDGLVVTLQTVEASKIVYVCDECLQLSSSDVDAQANASKQWHFAKVPFAAKKTLPRSAAFLQRVVAKWRNNTKRENASEMERFIDEITAKKPKGVDRGGENSSEITCNRKQQRKFVAQLPDAYRRRMNICLELITDTNLADRIIDAGGKDLLSNAARLMLLKSVRDKMGTLKRIHEAGSEPVLLPEYHQRVEVLKALKYVGSDGLSVQLKGRCACEVATVDSVVLTELIVENVLDNLEPAEIASLLSSLVCRKKNSGNIHSRDEERYSPEYRDAKGKVRNVVENFGKAQEEAGVELEFDIGDGEDYEGSICRWELAHAIYEWARGGAFFTITELTEQQEGDIVVCVKRLIELLRDAQAVAKIIGNMELLEVLETAVESIRRDVVFNGSLYYDRPTSGEDLSETDSEDFED